MDEDPDFKLLAVVADAPLAHFRRVLDQLIAREQAMKITGAGGSGPRAAAAAPGAGERLSARPRGRSRPCLPTSFSPFVCFLKDPP
jgi:hypothetical protein